MEDPRAIANFVLEIAERRAVPVSNLSLNKICYFVHGIHLAKYGEPLIDAKIEAWQFGPVFREIYHEFKKFGDGPITERAQRINLQTQEREMCVWNLPIEKENILATYVEDYLRIRPSVLVQMSHVHNGPWYNSWHHDDQVNPGMEITNDAIMQYFKVQVRH